MFLRRQLTKLSVRRLTQLRHVHHKTTSEKDDEQLSDIPQLLPYGSHTHPDEYPASSMPSQHTLAIRSKLKHLLPLYPQPTPIFTAGHGCVVFDSEGREYLDLTAGIAVSSLGHNDAEVY